MSQSTRVHRHSASSPCPICKGHDGIRRGQGERCHGYLSSDGQWARCTREQFAGDLEIEPKSGAYVHRLHGMCKCGIEHGPELPRVYPTNGRSAQSLKTSIDKTYDYVDASGELIFQVVRLSPKSFRQRRPDGRGGWLWDLKGVEPTIYRLPEILQADPEELIWIVEGEKDADSLKGVGISATSGPGGAGKWKLDFARYFAGRRVCVAPDADPIGLQHAESVAKSLVGVAASIKIIDLAAECERLGLGQLPEKGDASDFISMGGSAADLKAVAERTPEFAVPAKSEADTNPFGRLSDEELGLLGASSLDPEPISWLWSYRVAQGKLNLIAGEGGDGKSQLAIAIAAAVSNGGKFPDGSGPATVGRCLLLAAEDGARDTIVPRLRAAGAEAGLITILTARLTTKDRDGRPLINLMSFQDLSYWREIFRRLPDTRLLVCDPLPAYLGRGINDHRNNEIRAVLEPFLAVCEEFKVALIGITHLGKSTDVKTPVHKILGSVAYSNLSRTVHLTVRDPDDRERRLLLQVKSNLARPQPALAYKVESHSFEHYSQAIETSRLVFETEAVEADANALMCGAKAKANKRRGPDPKKTKELGAWLFDFLAERLTPVALGAIFDAAGDAGFIGEKTESDRWSNPAALYRAKDVVPELEAPRNGWRIENLSRPVKPGGRDVVHWQLWAADSNSNTNTR